ncbi:MAG: VWA domain-containing protein [Planctomycetota bacterium]|nr:VWA domain-containing protein [Planctomycetota bacterium]
MTGAILAAVLIPPLILLYFLKLRRRPQPIACTLLWKRTIEDLHANAPFQRLRRSLLLFLQLLALLLLVLSVMQPQIQASRPEAGKLVMLIDNSASMTATDVEDAASRLEVAKQRARDRIESIYSGGWLTRSAGETMIVAFSDRAEPTAGFSGSRQELLAAIDRIRPTHGQTEIAEALKLARAHTSNPVDPITGEARPVGDLPRLELFSDGRISDITDQVIWRTADAEDERPFVYHRIGSERPDNVAITAIEAQRPYDRPTTVEVFAALLNHNESSVSCDVQLSVDLTTMAVEEVAIPAATADPDTGALLPGRNNVVFTPFEQPRGAVIEVANLRDDDLAADNIVRAVVPPPRQLTIGLVAPRSFLLRSVLEGMSLKRLELLTAGQYERLAEADGLEAYDVIVFDRYAPPTADLMPPGRYLTFGPAPPVEGLNEYGEGAAQIVLSTRGEHPALRFVNLDQLFIGDCRLLQPADDVQVLAEGTEGPIIVAVSRGAMQIIHVTFDPLDTNWPFLRSFVTFVFNAVDYLGHIGAGVTEQGFEVGEALTTRLPATASNIELTLPDGTVEPLSPGDPSRLSWGPIRLTGIYALSWNEPETDEIRKRFFAVNLPGESEGRLDAAENLAVGQETVAAATGDTWGYTPLWPWAIAFCLAVLMFEWWVYHRKTYV